MICRCLNRFFCCKKKEANKPKTREEIFRQNIDLVIKARKRLEGIKEENKPLNDSDFIFLHTFNWTMKIRGWLHDQDGLLIATKISELNFIKQLTSENIEKQLKKIGWPNASFLSNEIEIYFRMHTSVEKNVLKFR